MPGKPAGSGTATIYDVIHNTLKRLMLARAASQLLHFGVDGVQTTTIGWDPEPGSLLGQICL
eukprot:758377-Hanusia_phi.AAC.8